MSYDAYSILQLVLLVFTTVLCHICATDPNSNLKSDYMPNENIGLKTLVIAGPIVGKLLLWLSTLYQVLYLYLRIFSLTSIPVLFPSTSTESNLLPLTAASVVGYILIVVGGLGRIWCYRTLGTFFTFRLTIRQSHKLIKTGPYTYVRHPSYTFIGILVVGVFLIHQRLSNFFPHAKWTQMVFSPVGYAAVGAILMFVFITRVAGEEKELKKAFGKEWIDYASKTKRFIPRVF